MGYSQTDEEAVILTYFKGGLGVCFDIGANDGVTFSNSRALVELGWEVHLFEPDPEAFKALEANSALYPNAHCQRVAVGDTYGVIDFEQANDSLYSTAIESQKGLWPSLTWSTVNVVMMGYKDVVEQIGKTPDFISIDAEGMDWIILQEIDLTDVKMVCIEPGGQGPEIDNYCKKYGMQLLHRTFENSIYGR